MFDVRFPDVVPARFQRKLAHIDANGSSACDLGEPTFFDHALANQDVTLTVTPDDVRMRAAVADWCTAVNDWILP
jgi:hypothetical protein